MSGNANYTNVLLEEIRSQNTAVLEIVGGMRAQMKQLATKEALKAVADDVKVIKAALRDTNKEVREFDRRVTRLGQDA
jgi:hypothetical protein